MSHRGWSVAVVGATGAVGTEIVGCLDKSPLVLKSLRLLASERSAGRRSLSYHGDSVTVEALTEHSLRGIDVALFSAGSVISRRHAAAAVAQGTIVIDNSSAFRMDSTVPLIVPEVNGEALDGHRGLIANPNCVAIIAAVVLWPLHQAFGLRRIIASTYQAASGAGAAAMEELKESTRAALWNESFVPKVLRHPYAFNLYSHDSAVDPATGSNEEEIKVARELRKILGLPELAVGVTCIRVPVLRAHAISLSVELSYRPTAQEARELLSRSPGVRIVDDMEKNHFPMPVEASGSGEVLVGRIRHDESDPSGRTLALFVCGDQLLKGAALNAVQIAERVTSDALPEVWG
jgi:aspartate-semialdehyde dehydrogenase